MRILSLSLVLALLLPRTAHAYIDPGSGSLLLQSLIAIAVGGWLTFRLFASNLWRRIRGERETPAESDAESPSDGSGR